jgi:hypothetical protein
MNLKATRQNTATGGMPTRRQNARRYSLAASLILVASLLGVSNALWVAGGLVLLVALTVFVEMTRRSHSKKVHGI